MSYRDPKKIDLIQTVQKLVRERRDLAAASAYQAFLNGKDDDEANCYARDMVRDSVTYARAAEEFILLTEKHWPIKDT